MTRRVLQAVTVAQIGIVFYTVFAAPHLFIPAAFA